MSETIIREEQVLVRDLPATRVVYASEWAPSGEASATYITACPYCEDMKSRGFRHFPDHFARHHPHCTCDGCW